MKRIIACIDTSDQAINVCKMAEWLNQQTGIDIFLLHVSPIHTDKVPSDLTGTIGLGSKSKLLSKLSHLDEDYTRVALKKGTSLLEECSKYLTKTKVQIMHRRGEITDTVLDQQVTTDILVIGRSKNPNVQQSTKNILDNTKSPVVIASKNVQVIKKALIVCKDVTVISNALDTYKNTLQNIDTYLALQKTDNNIDRKNIVNVFKDKEIHLPEENILRKNSHDYLEEVQKHILEHNIDVVVTNIENTRNIQRLFCKTKHEKLITETDVNLLLSR